MPKRERVDIEESSGNVFADLNLDTPVERRAKVWLSVLINRIIDERGLTQKQAAQLLGVSQPKISALRHCKMENFSVARLMNFANALEYDVEIQLRLRDPSEGSGRIIVAVVA